MISSTLFFSLCTSASTTIIVRADSKIRIQAQFKHYPYLSRVNSLAADDSDTLGELVVSPERALNSAVIKLQSDSETACCIVKLLDVSPTSTRWCICSSSATGINSSTTAVVGSSFDGATGLSGAFSTARHCSLSALADRRTTTAVWLALIARLEDLVIPGFAPAGGGSFDRQDGRLTVWKGADWWAGL